MRGMSRSRRLLSPPVTQIVPRLIRFRPLDISDHSSEDMNWPGLMDMFMSQMSSTVAMHWVWKFAKSCRFFHGVEGEPSLESSLITIQLAKQRKPKPATEGNHQMEYHCNALRMAMIGQEWWTVQSFLGLKFGHHFSDHMLTITWEQGRGWVELNTTDAHFDFLIGGK